MDGFDITPTALISGHGERVCAFLLAIANHLLKAEDFTFKPHIHADSQPTDIVDNDIEEVSRNHSDQKNYVMIILLHF